MSRESDHPHPEPVAGRARRASRPLVLFSLGAGLLAAACGGGGGGGGGTAAPASGGTLSGAVVKGPVSGASVAAFAVTNGAKAGQLGAATTDAQGRFTMSLDAHSGPVLLEASGGTYTDEATGATMAMQGGSVMTAVVPAADAGSASDVQVTPLTAMAQARAQHMPGGMTPANVTAANGEIGGYFSVGDILHTMPMDPLAQGSGAAATQEMKDYGMTIAAMSQYAAMIGMTGSSSGVVAAMMGDASDGVMNGMAGSTAISMNGMGGMMGGSLAPTAGTTDLADAMDRFMTSGMNRSGVGVADMQALMDRLRASDGQLAGTGGGAAGGTVSGRAFMGRIASGTMSAFAVQGGALGAELASAPVDADGNFSLSVGSYAGPVMLRMSGASYVDEATGATMTMLPRDVLTAAIPSMTAGAGMGGVQVTPLTSMAQVRAQAMPGGMTPENVTAANSALGDYFSCGDILTTAPMDPSVQGAGAGADPDGRNYGMSIAAMSQYAETLGMSTSSGLVTVMMDDATDGVMNGMMGTTPISMSGMGGMMGGGNLQPTLGTSGLAEAMSAFVQDTTVNRSGVGLPDMQPLIDQLQRSQGVLQ